MLDDFIIKSERLILKPLNQKDLVPFHKAVNDSLDHLLPWVSWVEVPFTIEKAEDLIQKAQRHFQLKEACQLALWRESDFIGMCGFNTLSLERLTGDIGYWCHKSFLRQGYILEAVKVLIDFAFNNLNLKMLSARCDVQNKRSQLIPEKCGFKYVFQMPGSILGCEDQKLSKFYILNNSNSVKE